MMRSRLAFQSSCPLNPESVVTDLPPLEMSLATAYLDPMQALARELRLTLRRLIRDPALAGIAVIAFALGIGLTASMYSIAYSVLFRGLPVEDSEALVFLSLTEMETGDYDRRNPFLDYLDWRERQTTFTDLGAYRTLSVNLALSATHSGETDTPAIPRSWAGLYAPTANSSPSLESCPRSSIFRSSNISGFPFPGSWVRCPEARGRCGWWAGSARGWNPPQRKPR